MPNARLPENPPPSRKTAVVSFQGIQRHRHSLAAVAGAVTPHLFGRAEVSVGSGRSACLESGCLAPDTRAWPPMLPADTSDGRRLVAWSSQGIRSPGRVRFAAEPRIDGTDAEDRRGATVPSGVYCAPQTRRQPLEYTHLHAGGYRCPSSTRPATPLPSNRKTSGNGRLKRAPPAPTTMSNLLRTNS